MPFDPVDLTQLNSKYKSILPDEIWTPILEHGCSFPPHIFTEVMLNLIKNPNLNSSHLFRADILYDSHGILTPSKQEDAQSPNVKEHGIMNVYLPDLELQRTIVRKLIPRNAQLDKALIQTCHILHRTDADAKDNGRETTLVLYLPHASTPTEIPHYHPAVHGIAFQHTWAPPPATSSPGPTPEPPPPTGTLTLHYALYPSPTSSPQPPLPLPPRLHRTAHQLLHTLHKHGTGSQSGYVKRVHHDQIIPQQRVQDTYAALKARHARRLLDNWAEQTPASKHVFEDLGIAAFLLELWADLYGKGARDSGGGFPGFVDVGCGNGVLVDVLVREGYEGWGFDARARKSWRTFGPEVMGRLRACVLVPRPVVELHPELAGAVDFDAAEAPAPHSSSDDDLRLQFHNGVFPPHTFIISNHADELTPWTPLLASLSRSAFLAIPCCSHDLSGARSRAHVPSLRNDKKDGPEKGDLRTLRASAKQPSAYASLVAWVERLASEVGFGVEREVLRIPSTRNVGIVGRGLDEDWRGGEREGEGGWREAKVRDIVRREGGAVGWIERAVALAGPGKARAH